MPKMIQHEIAKAGRAFGESLPDDVNNVIVETIAHAEEAKKGPYYTLLELMASIGADGLNALPEPGVPEFEEVDGVARKNNNAAVFKYNNDNNREVTGDYFNFAFDWTPAGTEIDNLLDALSKADNPSSPYHGMAKGEIEAKRKNAQNRRTTGRKALRVAVGAWHTMRYINEIPGVQCYIQQVPVLDDKGKAVKNEDGSPQYTYTTDNPTPFRVIDTSEVGPDGRAVVTKVKEYSATSLCTLDPKYIIANGGGWSELLKTAARDTEEDDTDEDEALAVTPDNFTAVFGMIANLIERPDTYGKVVKAMTGKNADPHAIVSFGNAMVELIPLFNKVLPTYNSILEKRGAAVGQVAAALMNTGATQQVKRDAA